MADDAADIAVLSTGVLDAAERRLGELLVRLLEPGTYYGPGHLVVVRRQEDRATEPRTVAIDRDSPDHVALTEASFPAAEGYTFIDHPFPDVPAAVLRGDVDAGVWHRRPSVIPIELAGLRGLPLPERAEQVWAGISAAALVASTRRAELKSVLHGILTSGNRPDPPSN